MSTTTQSRFQMMPSMERPTAVSPSNNNNNSNNATTSAAFYVSGRLALSAPFSARRSGTRVVNADLETKKSAGGGTMKSQSIPIHSNGMKRTPSELQLCEEEQMADFRDYVMFSRIVDGIARQQRSTKSYWLRRENDMCLEHIIGTRNGTTAGDDDWQTRALSAEQSAMHARSPFEQHHHHHHQQQQALHKLSGCREEQGEEEDEMFILDL